MRAKGHTDDVNAVAFAERDNSNIFFSGSDDLLCKVWDRRQLSSGRVVPVGVFVGHTEGVAHIDSKVCLAGNHISNRVQRLQNRGMGAT